MLRRIPPIVVLLVLLLPRPASATPGALDRTFSDNGVQTAFRGGGTAYAVAIDPRDRIVVAGETVGAAHDVAVARLRPGGALDHTFGGDGRVRIDLGASDRALDVVAASNGGIVVVGERTTAHGSSWFVLRLKSGGARDRSFGGDGIVFTDFGRRYESADAVAIRPGGKILAAGSVSNGTTESWAFARYGPDGARDASFGGDGRVTMSLSVSAERVQDLAVTGTGILAAGYAESNFIPRFAIAKLRADGQRAQGFGNHGVRFVNVGAGADSAFGLAVQPDGKPVLAGYASAGGRADWGVVRLGPGGALDQGFGGDGIVTTPFTSSYELAYGVAIQSDGRIVVAGGARGANGTNDLAVVRYRGNGALDPSFSGNGKALFDPAGEDDVARDVVVHAGKIVVVGESMAGGVQRMVVIRVRTI